MLQGTHLTLSAIEETVDDQEVNRYCEKAAAKGLHGSDAGAVGGHQADIRKVWVTSHGRRLPRLDNNRCAPARHVCTFMKAHTRHEQDI